MKKNDIITLKITDINTSGEGIGRFDGLAFFVKNAVSGDEVEAVITKLKKGYGYAKMLRLVSPSPYRVPPVCKCASACGGCQIMQLSYEKQLGFKEEKIKNNLKRIGGFSFDDTPENSGTVFFPVIGMIPEDAPELQEKLPEASVSSDGHCMAPDNNSFVPLHFRNKMQFPVGYNKDGHIITGFYAGRTHYIIENEDCPVSSFENAAILKAICSFAEKNGLSVYNEETGKGLLRHILIRNGFRTGQIMVCLVINADNLEKELSEKLVETLISINKNISCICLNINKKKTNVILGDDIRLLSGTPYIEDTLQSGLPDMRTLKFRVSVLSFFQTNPIQTEKLYDCTLSFAGLKGDETVWDLYCGTGSISLFLAQKAKKVYGVEIVPEAIEDAKKNARLNGIENAEFICGRSEDIFTERACKMSPENLVVVLDPPRKGCDAKLLEAIKAVGPERIVYVSCDSATLARDLKILCSEDPEDAACSENKASSENNKALYKIEKIRPVDMFPHTVHVETVVLMSRKYK